MPITSPIARILNKKKEEEPISIGKKRALLYSRNNNNQRPPLSALFSGVAPMVQDAKAVAINTSDGPSVSRWRDSNRAVSPMHNNIDITLCSIVLPSAHVLIYSTGFSFFIPAAGRCRPGEEGHNRRAGGRLIGTTAATESSIAASARRR